MLTPSQHTQLEEPGSAIYLKGVVQVWEPHVSSQTALRSGNTIVSSGERVRINDIRPNSDDMIALSISSISRVPEPNVSRGLFDFALVHTRTGDAFGLMQGGGRSFGVGSLPLANVRRRNVGLVLERNARSNYALQVDEFQLVRIRWRSLGSYPVDIEVVKQRPEQPR